jgi:hypothetical protein
LIEEMKFAAGAVNLHVLFQINGGQRLQDFRGPRGLRRGVRDGDEIGLLYRLNFDLFSQAAGCALHPCCRALAGTKPVQPVVIGELIGVDHAA